MLPVFPTVLGMLLLLLLLLTPMPMRPQDGLRQLKGRRRWRPDHKARQQWKKRTLQQRAGATGKASSVNHPTTQLISQHRPAHGPCGDLRPAAKIPSQPYGAPSALGSET